MTIERVHGMNNLLLLGMTKLRLATKNNTKEEKRAINAEWAAAYPDPEERKRAKNAECVRKYRATPEGRAKSRKYSAKNKAKIDERSRKHYEKNRAKLLERRRKYYEENKAKEAEQKRKYHAKPEIKAKRQERARKYREESGEKVAETSRKYKQENKAKIAERARKYREENKAKSAEYQRNRRSSDPIYKIGCCARGVIQHAFKSQSVSKTCSSFKLLGCTGKFYSDYLLNHPTAKRLGFTAENHGTIWHIDHIKPVASFDLRDESQQMEAFNFKNCQPMLATENMSKGSFFAGKRHRHKKVA